MFTAQAKNGSAVAKKIASRRTTKKRQPPTMESARPSEARFHETWSSGDAAHQGDLILVNVGVLPSSAKPRASRQLADGDTKGSKHVLIGGSVFNADPAECAKLIKSATGRTIEPKYIGPVFSGECELTHPQHQHQKFPAHEATVVVFQRNLSADEREERARD